MKKIVTSNKIYLISVNILRLFIMLAIWGAAVERNWTTLFISSLTLILTFLPFIIERNYKIYLPLEFELAIIIFMYASLFLGEIHGYYTRFWWWDIILHTSSGIAFGLIGFIILYILYKGDKIVAKPSTIAIFSFSFALAIGTLWEIFEFSIDVLIGTNFQKSGLLDTMWDLIVDSLGALIASLLGYFYIKKERVRFFNRLMRKFEKQNPELFGRKK